MSRSLSEVFTPLLKEYGDVVTKTLKHDNPNRGGFEERDSHVAAILGQAYNTAYDKNLRMGGKNSALLKQMQNIILAAKGQHWDLVEDILPPHEFENMMTHSGDVWEKFQKYTEGRL